MNKHFLKFIPLILITGLSCNQLLAGIQKHDPGKTSPDNLRNSGPLKPTSMLSFSTDVVMKPDTTENQTDVKVAAIFNGWIYSVFTTHNGTADGIYSIQSKDHGVTWDTLISSPGFFYSSDIIVCGMDTNSLDLYLSSIQYDSTTGNHTYWVTKNNGRTGAFVNLVISESTTDTIYDVALAHDFFHPASVASPYSIEAVYSKHGLSEDSIIANISLNGGATFTDRKIVDTDSGRFGKISLSYGYSPDFPNGQYFVAYEQHAAGEKYGHIKVSRTGSLVTDTFTIPIFLDSVYASIDDTAWANHGSNPSISVQNSATGNDSSGLTAVVLWESAYNGTDDIDCVGAYSFQSGSSTGLWNHCWVDFFLVHTFQPDICYDETHNKFLVTYWDSSDHYLKYYNEDFNLPNPTLWTQVISYYNDMVGTLIDPCPQIAFNPLYSSADFAWNEIRSSYRAALFDAEFSAVGIQEDHTNKFSVIQNYPNPASDYTLFSFDLDKPQSVLLEVYDLVGNRISINENENLAAGSHQFKMDVSHLPAGYYTCTLKTVHDRYSSKLLVIH